MVISWTQESISLVVIPGLIRSATISRISPVKREAALIPSICSFVLRIIPDEV